MTSPRLSSGCLYDAFPRPWLTQLWVVGYGGHVEANEALELRKLQGPVAPTADLDISLTIPAPVPVTMFLRLQCAPFIWGSLKQASALTSTGGNSHHYQNSYLKITLTRVLGDFTVPASSGPQNLFSVVFLADHNESRSK